MFLSANEYLFGVGFFFSLNIAGAGGVPGVPKGGGGGAIGVVGGVGLRLPLVGVLGAFLGEAGFEVPNSSAALMIIKANKLKIDFKILFVQDFLYSFNYVDRGIFAEKFNDYRP